MGMKISEIEAYEESIHKLFPRGPYWDKQFEDPESDCSLFCKAKAGLIVRLRGRMEVLLNESVIQTADETLDSWERVILGKGSIGLDPSQRKAILAASNAGNFNADTIKAIGRMYDVSISKIEFPFRPAFFAHACFGTDPMASPAAFAVLFIYASQPDPGIKEDFEDQVMSRVLSNYIVYFVYGGE